MKIMLVARVVPQHRPGGMPHVTWDRAEALVKAGHEVLVVTTGIAGEKVVNSDDNPAVFYTDSPSQRWSQQFAACCEGIHKRVNPDVLHSDSFDRAHPWWIGKPVHVTMHGFGVGAFLTDWNRYRTGVGGQPKFSHVDMRTEAKALSEARTVIGVSRWEWRMLRDQYGLRQAKMVYNPIAPCFFEDSPRGVGDIGPAPYKERIYFLCAAVSQGETRGFDVAQRAAKLAGVELRVLRDVPRHLMPNAYDGAKALVLPTAFCQGFDLAVAEARARGCPAILSPTGSYLDEAKPWDASTEIGDVDGLTAILKNWQQPTVPVNAADEHRPERHAERWLEAVS